MSADPRRLGQEDSLTSLFARVRALEQRVYRPHFAHISILNAYVNTGSGPDFQYIDFPSTTFNTSDDLSFAYGLDTWVGTVHTINILQGGLYAITGAATIYPDADIGSTVTIGTVEVLHPVIPNIGNYNWVVSSFGHAGPGISDGLINLAWFTEMQVGDESVYTFPVGPPIFLKQGTSGPYHADVSLYIEQRSVEAIPLV